MQFKDLPEYLSELMNEFPVSTVELDYLTAAIQRYADEYAAAKNPWRPIEEFSADYFRGKMVLIAFRHDWYRRDENKDMIWNAKFYHDKVFECDVFMIGAPGISDFANPTHFYDERIQPLPKAGK